MNIRTWKAIATRALAGILHESFFPAAHPGLYVIGNDSGCFFANEYPNLATGMACGRTVTFGRIVDIELARS